MKWFGMVLMGWPLRFPISQNSFRESVLIRSNLEKKISIKFFLCVQKIRLEFCRQPGEGGQAGFLGFPPEHQALCALLAALWASLSSSSQSGVW